MPAYNAYKTYLLSPAALNLLSATVKVALLSSAYTPDIDANQFWSDVSANEVVGAGYTAGGQALANKTVSQDNANDRGKFDADDTNWPGSTITARYAVLYQDTGVPGTSHLLGYIDFLTNKSSNGGTFSLQWQAAGIVVTQ